MTTLAVASVECPKVDVGALTGAIYHDVTAVLADSLVLGFDWNEEKEHELNQAQKVEMVQAALLSASNLEARIAAGILSTLETEGVEGWGLDSNMQRLFNVSRDAEAQKTQARLAEAESVLAEVRGMLDELKPKPRPTLTTVDDA